MNEQERLEASSQKLKEALRKQRFIPRLKRRIKHRIKYWGWWWSTNLKEWWEIFYYNYWSPFWIKAPGWLGDIVFNALDWVLNWRWVVKLQYFLTGQAIKAQEDREKENRKQGKD